MEDKYQQLYDYISTNQKYSSLLSDGVTPESFKEMYVSGDKNMSSLFQVMALDDDKPFETGDMSAFSKDFFGVEKKNDQLPDPPDPSESFLSAYPSVRPSAVASSRADQLEEQGPGDSDYTIRPGFNALFGVPDVEVSREPQFLKGIVGDVVNSIPVLGEIFDHAARATATGYSNVKTMDEARFMFNNPSEESVQEFFVEMMRHQKNLEDYGESEDMQNFLTSANKYIKEDGNSMGGFKALAENPQVAYEFLLQSGLNNLDPKAIEEGLKVFTTGIISGGATGFSFAGPFGVIPGMLTGGRLSVPFAMAAAGGEVESVMSSIEFLNEELQKEGLDFTPENILTILQDDEKYKSIRNRALTRKVTISMIDGTLGSLFSQALRAVRVAEKANTAVLVGTQIAADVATGGGGEMLARELADQPQDPLEITLEAATGPVTQTPVNLVSTYVGVRQEIANKRAQNALYNKPNRYFINDARVDADAFSDVVETATNEQLLQLNIRVENDERMSGYLERKVELAQIEESLPQGASPEQRSQLIELETRLRRLEGKTGRTPETQRKKYNNDIDAIVNSIVDEAESTAPVDPKVVSDSARKLDVVEDAENEGAAINEQERLEQEEKKNKENREGAKNLREAQKDDGIFEKKSYGLGNAKEFFADVLKGRTGFQRRWLNARRFMPRSMFRASESKEAFTAVEMNNVRIHAKEFGRLEADVSKENRDEWASQFDEVLRGGKAGNLLNPSAISLAKEMRTNVDNLSLRLINEGAVKMSEVDAIVSNLDTYLTRSYKLFDQKNWKDQLASQEGQTIVNQAKDRLRRSNYENIVGLAEQDAYRNPDGTLNKNYTPENNPKQLDFHELMEERLDGKIAAILNKDGNSFASNPKLTSKDLNVLKERKEVPVEIRALMGEFSDPIQNYAQTILRQSQLAEANRALNSIKKAGMGVYLFNQPDGEFNVQIASEGSEALSPLNGLYTTREIADEFNKSGMSMDFKGPSEKLMGAGFAGWMKVTGSVKWAKTIGSVGTHFKNVFGNLGFMWANGHVPMELRETHKVIRNDIGSMSDAELNAKMNKYISLGIVKQSAGLGEVKSMLGEEGNFDDVVGTRLDSKGKKLFQRGKKYAEDLYQAEDDFFKIIAYENEVRRYSQAEYGVLPSELTEQQSMELDAKVAEIVKNTYPTYSRTPEAVRFLKLNPVIGNFVSFQAESYRTSWNILNIARQEIASDNPRVKAIGVKRLAGITSFQGAKTGLIATMGSSVGAGIMGVAGALNPGATDQERQRERDIRMFLPDWSKNSDLLPLSGVENGKFKYKDVSASDPFGGMSKVMNSIALADEGEGKGLGMKAFIDGYIAILEPFVGVDIATRRGANLLKNEDDYGRKIYNPEDTWNAQTEDILSYGYKVLEPGTFTSVRKIYNSDGKLNEAFGQFTGLKTFEVDFGEQFGYIAKGLGERMKDAKALRRSENTDYNIDFYEQEDVDNANRALSELETEMHEYARAANRMGVPKDYLIQQMVQMTRGGNNVGLSRQRAENIYENIFINLEPER